MPDTSRTARWGFVATVFCGLCWGFPGAGAPPEKSAERPRKDALPPVDFQQEIRPLLSDRCFQCHGPGKHRGGLRLDNREDAYEVIEPGNSADSEICYRITAKDTSERMPPRASHKTLCKEEIAKIVRWINEGAPWKEHWAFVPPKRPELPDVRDTSWPRNPVDRFVLARIEAARLKPMPEADRRTLIRRVTFDLTGLPPTLQEVKDFLEDRSPGAYERAVDRLLRSPRYGEHMARYWLDAARYGDTHGLHLDNFRTMWPYRDWVIQAYNDNMPFDRFTIEQLAGDLLPKPTTAQRIATGFNRCNVTTSEGGAINEEFYVRYAVDRVETTSTVWMGLTVGCAACHDHKFDPITQKEFYQLFAYFNNVAEPAMDGNKAAVPPFLNVPLPGAEARRKALAPKIAELEKKRTARSEAAKPAFESWLAKASGRTKSESLPAGLIAHFPLDAAEGPLANTVEPRKSGAVQGTRRTVDGKFGKAFHVDGGHVDFGQIGDFEQDQSFSYGAWIRTPGNVTGAALARMDTGNKFRGWDLYLVNRRVAAHIIHRWSDRAIKVTTTKEVLEPDKWHHVFVTYNGSGKAAGVSVYVDGKKRPVDVNNDNLEGQTIRTKVALKVGQRNTDSYLKGSTIDDVRLFDRALDASEVAAVAGVDPIGPILELPPEKRTVEQRKILFDHFLARHDKPYQELTRQWRELRDEDRKLAAQVVATLVMEERKKPRDAHVLDRGQYDQPREKVERGTPAVLPPLPEDSPPNRLGLARWIVSPSHPLTARVAVNRYWQRLFGTGIVKTAEDFGSQGDPPSHPLLLDWLATEFVRTGWNVKQMQKLLVMSATYRQASRMSPESWKRDPENRLLARGPRFRLDAEMLRDQALAASGLLVETLGGPSVKPPQPAGLWFAVGYSGSNTVRFKADKGDAVYRRSVYTFLKRTAPPPAMSTFDAPSRESCVVRRERTNTPLQALLLLNDEQYVEAARFLAQRCLQESGRTPWSVAERMFTRATCRPPGAGEMAVILSAYEDHRTQFAASPDSARKLIQVGKTKPDPSLDPVELAAWTMAGNLILNLDEVINKT